MKRYIEFWDDDKIQAVDKLNDYIRNNSVDVTIAGYNVVRYEQINKERTYILAEVIE